MFRAAWTASAKNRPFEHRNLAKTQTDKALSDSWTATFAVGKKKTGQRKRCKLIKHPSEHPKHPAKTQTGRAARPNSRPCRGKLAPEYTPKIL